jgi:hypothetical protein
MGCRERNGCRYYQFLSSSCIDALARSDCDIVCTGVVLRPEIVLISLFSFLLPTLLYNP